jgi:DNA polymerase-3 subunit delta
VAARKPSGTAAKASIPQLQWHEVRPAPIVLITGPESLLAERAARMLRDAMKQQDPSVEVSDLRAGEYAPGELVTLASPSLFGEPRLIRVDGAEKSTDGFIADALDYVAAPADGAVLLLRHAGGVRGKKLLDAIRGGAGGGIEITCAELKKDADKYDFARAEFGRAGKKITPGALRSLTQAFTDDLAELAAACTQLIADASAEISEQVVDRYNSGRVETNAFRVADAAIAGQYGDALVTLRHALSSGADPVPIVAAFASKVRTMARLYGARGSSAQLAGQFGLAPWQVDRARRDLQGWTDAGLARSFEVLAQTDAAVKGAGRDPVFALETMISVISSRGMRLR